MDRSWSGSAIAIVLVMALGTTTVGQAPAADTQPDERFTVLAAYHGEAVLDRTTQLIWERSPLPMAVTWTTAINRCTLKTVGSHGGWRLPTFLELMTLVEPRPQQASTVPALPPSHPFLGVKAAAYWTTDTPASESAQAYAVDFLLADVATRQKNQAYPLWCVRGGISDAPPPSQSIQHTGLI